MQKIAIVLAAGNGARMNSTEHIYNKVCYPILGKPIVGYVLDAIKPLNFDKTVLVAGVGKDNTIAKFSEEYEIVVQEKQLGTGDAIKQVLESLPEDDSDILVIYGDVPLIQSETLEKMSHHHAKNKCDATLLTAIVTEPRGQNRVVRDDKTNEIIRVNDFKEESNGGYLTTEVEVGAYIVKAKHLHNYIPKLKKDRENGEFSLISIFEDMISDGLRVDGFILADNSEAYSINDRSQLAHASNVIRRRVNTQLMMDGVTIEDLRTAFISPDAQIEADTIISPNTTILGKCKIGKGNNIGPNTYLENVELGSHNKIVFSYITNSKIGDNQEIGPYAHIKDNKVIKGGD